MKFRHPKTGRANLEFRRCILMQNTFADSGRWTSENGLKTSPTLLASGVRIRVRATMLETKNALARVE